MKPQAMIHQHAYAHFARAVRHGSKMQRRRCNQIEIPGIGKKREHFLA